MYLQYFGFTREPFELPPNSDFLFLSKTHKKALVYLNYALWNRDTFTLITGGVGTGKTILLQRLLHSIPDETRVIKINQTQISPIELLSVVANELGIDAGSHPNKAFFYGEINKLFKTRQEHSIVLVIDEAQNLPPETFEEIRLFAANDLAPDEKSINVIFCGQPELAEKIAMPKLEQLQQRIRLKFSLTPLDNGETAQYVTSRLSRAGQTLDLFTPEALARVFFYSGGIPRKINIIADTALTCAFADGKLAISSAVVDDAAEELDWEGKKPGQDPRFLTASSERGTAPLAQQAEKNIVRLARPQLEPQVDVAAALEQICDHLNSISGTLAVMAKTGGTSSTAKKRKLK